MIVEKGYYSYKVGTGFLGLLTLLFIGLKLTGYVDWSWWIVLAPIWAPIAIGLAALFFAFVVMLIAGLAKGEGGHGAKEARRLRADE